jgi:uncharacterized protein YbjT (DUF2867 family)
MAGKRILAVVGATGAQGGGLVRAILADPGGEFAARAITRDPESPAAKALARAGAEVVRGDVADPASLRAAFAGAHAAYCVTFFWAHMDPEREMAEARAQAEAARDARVQHVVWSTLEDTRAWVPLSDPRMPTLHGRYKVPHFDAKGEADRFFADAGLPVTYLLTSFYWDNFIHFGMGPRRDAGGRAVLALPMGRKRLAGIAAEDIGGCAYGLFRKGAETVGRRIGIAGEHLTGAELAATFTRVLGEEVRYEDVPVDAYRKLGFPGADDLGNMFQVYQEFEAPFAAARPVEAARALNPGLQSFETWLRRNGDRVRIG